MAANPSVRPTTARTRPTLPALIAALLIFAAAAPALAQNVPAQTTTPASPAPAGSGAASTASDSAPATREPVKVGIRVSPPFVIRDGDQYRGMAVDIWTLIAEKLERDYQYVPFKTVRELLDATQTGDVDIAVSNISITRARAERVDFTQPWFDAGLRIMINTDGRVGWRAVIEGLADAGFLRAYAWLGGVMVLATVLLTLFDRRFNPNFPKRWRDGVAESFYAVMSVATSGRMPSRPNLFGWAGRIMQAFWLICGIAVIAYITSSVTSVMTSLTIVNQIRDFNDLRDKHVGVEDGSAAEDYLREEGVGTTTFDDIDAAVAGLLAGQVDALVSDSPVLEYYAITNPDEPLDVVGPRFHPDKYGFALPKTSNLDDQITVEILGALERQDIEDIRVRYFGDDP